MKPRLLIGSCDPRRPREAAADAPLAASRRDLVISRPSRASPARAAAGSLLTSWDIRSSNPCSSRVIARSCSWLSGCAIAHCGIPTRKAARICVWKFRGS